MHSGPSVDAAAVLRIDGIAAGGAGIGRVDGLATFVPRTAPGDLVRARLHRRRRFAEGTLVEVVSPGPDRVEPACAHYSADACGGCQLQHLSYAAQLVVKQDLVQQALARIGHRVVRVEPVRPSPAAWRYRNKLTLTIRGRGARRLGGLRRLRQPDEVFDLRECHLVTPEIEHAWGEVRAALAFLPPADDLRIVLRSDDGVVSVVVKGGDAWPSRDTFRLRCPGLGPIRHDRTHGDSPDDDDSVASLDAFAQVNHAMALEMERHVLEVLRAVEPARVIDAYGGQGRVARALSAEGRSVTLIESDPEATRIAEASCPGVDVQTARVEDALANALPADAVLLNPPRVGLHPAACEILERTTPRPRRVVYVSCDPATLARDLTRLPSWQVERASPFDLFPQTAHIETVCVLSSEVAR
jgi:23S rRNA (uracil1939-C5)-methyltransferase